MARLFASPYLLLTLSSIFWSGNAIIGRWLRDYVDAVDINVLRWIIAVIILAPFLTKPLLREWRYLKEHKLWLLFATLTGIVTFQSTLYLGLQTTSALNAVLMISSCPALITLINSIVYRDWIGLAGFTGVLISFLGIVVIISHGDWTIFSNFHFYPGDLWVMLASILWAVYSIALKRKPKEVSSSTLLFTTALVGLVFLIPWSLVYEEHREFQPWHATVYFNIAYLAICSSIFAFMCWNKGVELIGPNRAGIFLHLIPLFTAIFSFFFLGEHVHIYHLVGAACVFAGIWLTTRKKRNN